MQADHDQVAGVAGSGSRLDEVALAGESLEDVEDVSRDDGDGAELGAAGEPRELPGLVARRLAGVLELALEVTPSGQAAVEVGGAGGGRLEAAPLDGDEAGFALVDEERGRQGAEDVGLDVGLDVELRGPRRSPCAPDAVESSGRGDSLGPALWCALTGHQPSPGSQNGWPK